MSQKRKQSGGVKISGGKVDVGGDIVGRDKYVNYNVEGVKPQKVGCIGRTFLAGLFFLIPGVVGAAIGGLIGAFITGALGGGDPGAGGMVGAVVVGLFFAIGASSLAIRATGTRK